MHSFVHHLSIHPFIYLYFCPFFFCSVVLYVCSSAYAFHYLSFEFIMPFSLSGSMQVEAECVCVCMCVRACMRVCQISVGYSDSRAEGLSLVTFLQLYGVAPRSTSRRPFCFCSSTRKNRVRERDGGVLQEILLSKKRLNYDLGARETSRQKTETKTWKEFRELF